MNYVWEEFYIIHGLIKTYATNPIDIVSFKLKLKKWLENYLKINQKVNMKLTPYVHSFVYHIPELIEKHRDINLFNMEGLEKLNDLTKKYYFYSTNKHKKDNEYLVQLINKRNRIEFYNMHGTLDELKNDVNDQPDQPDQPIQPDQPDLSIQPDLIIETDQSEIPIQLDEQEQLSELENLNDFDQPDNESDEYILIYE